MENSFGEGEPNGPSNTAHSGSDSDTPVPKSEPATSCDTSAPVPASANIDMINAIAISGQIALDATTTSNNASNANGVKLEDIEAVTTSGTNLQDAGNGLVVVSVPVENSQGNHPAEFQMPAISSDQVPTEAQQHPDSGNSFPSMPCIPQEDDLSMPAISNIIAANTTLNTDDIPINRPNVAESTIIKSIPSNTLKQQDQWMLMLDRLKEYKAQYNTTCVPKRYKEKPSLGSWVETQRAQFKKMWVASGQSDDLLSSAPDPTIYVTPNKRLSAERLSRLQDIGFSWFVRKRRSTNGKRKASGDASSTSEGNESGNGAAHDPRKRRRKDEQWNEMYQRLVQFKDQHGHCIVPKGYAADPKLACWVETQRHLHSKHYSSPKEFSPLVVSKATAVKDSGTLDENNIEGVDAEDVATAAGDDTTAMGVSATPSQTDDNKKDANSGDLESPTVAKTLVQEKGVALKQDSEQGISVKDGAAAGSATVSGDLESFAAPAIVGTSEDVITDFAVDNDSAPNSGEKDVPMTDTSKAATEDGSDAPKNGDNLSKDLAVASDNAAAKRNVRLTAERKEKLDEIGFVSVYVMDQDVL